MPQINKIVIRNIQKSFIGFDIEKSRSGTYKDTPENRRLGRVGQKFGEKSGYLEDFKTIDRHSKDGIFSAYRKRIHKEILKKTIENGVVEEMPTVTLVMGGSASGKGTASKFIRDESEASEKLVVDVDNVKKVLPEYKDFHPSSAANNVHKESSFVGKSIRGEVIDSKMSFVNDGTFGDKDKALKLVKKLKEAGYKIKLINVTTDIDEAKKREYLRFKRSGRRVPEKSLEDTHIGGVDTYEALKEFADEYTLLDNNVEFGKDPIVIDDHKGGIIDKEKYNKFLNKRNYARITKK